MKINHDFKMPHDDCVSVSIFNVHSEDIKKGYKAFSAIYGQDALHVMKLSLKDGIMGIFDLKDDQSVMLALMITQAMNTRIELLTAY